MVIVFLSDERVFVVGIVVEPEARLIDVFVIDDSSSSPENSNWIEEFINTFTAFSTAIFPTIVFIFEFEICGKIQFKLAFIVFFWVEANFISLISTVGIVDGKA